MQWPLSSVLCCVMTFGFRSVQGHSSSGEYRLLGSPFWLVGGVAPRDRPYAPLGMRSSPQFPGASPSGLMMMINTKQ